MNVRNSIALGIAALATSAGLHLGGVQIFAKDETVQVQGGAQVVVARLGNSFRDVTNGENGTAPPEKLTEPVEPETLEKVAPEKPPEPPRPDSLQTPPKPTTSVEKPEPLKSAPLTQAMTAPVKVAPVTSSALAIQSAPIEMLKPVQTPPAVTTPPPEVMAALPDQNPDQLDLSSRPKLRPKTVEEEAAKRTPPKPEAKKKPKKKKKPRQGAKVKREVKGKESGKKTGTSTQATKKGKRRASKAGNAAVSNYPGKVNSKIRRQRRPRAKGKASARVSFKISSSGGLSSIHIARSSGDGKFDRDAMSIVRRAAPFPKPPPGARRSYVITIHSK